MSVSGNNHPSSSRATGATSSTTTPENRCECCWKWKVFPIIEGKKAAHCGPCMDKIEFGRYIDRQQELKKADLNVRKAALTTEKAGLNAEKAAFKIKEADLNAQKADYKIKKTDLKLRKKAQKEEQAEYKKFDILLKKLQFAVDSYYETFSLTEITDKGKGTVQYPEGAGDVTLFGRVELGIYEDQVKAALADGNGKELEIICLVSKNLDAIAYIKPK